MFNLFVSILILDRWPTLNPIRRPVFDASMDTFDALHERSPFAVDAICMVAARVRDGGGNACLGHSTNFLLKP